MSKMGNYVVGAEEDGTIIFNEQENCYEEKEKKMFKIKELTNRGNVDYRQNPNEPLYGTKTIKNIQVPKLSWLRGCVNTYIEEYELGSGNFVPAKVYKDDKYIGYFSYNAKFWRK